MNNLLQIKPLFYVTLSLVAVGMLYLIFWQTQKVRAQTQTLDELKATLSPVAQQIQKLKVTHQNLDSQLKTQLEAQATKSLHIKQLKEELSALESDIIQSSRELNTLNKERENFLKLSQSIRSTLASLSIENVTEIDKTKKKLTKEIKNLTVQVAKLETKVNQLRNSSSSETPSIIATVLSINTEWRFLIIDKGKANKFTENVGDKLSVTRHGKHIKNVTLEKIHETYSICNIVTNQSRVAPILKVGDHVLMTPSE